MDLNLDMCGTIGSNHFGQDAPTGAASTYYLSKTYTRAVDHSGAGIGPPAEHYEQEIATTYFYEDDYDPNLAFSGSCNSDVASSSSGSAFCPFVGSGGSTSYSVTGSAAAGYSIEQNYSIGAVDGDPTHSYTDVETWTYSDPISDQLAYLIGNAVSRAAFLGFIANGSSCESLIEILATDADGEATEINWKQSRFKWVIPDTWEGSYFKITWDIVNFPEDGDPSAVSTDNTWEWEGPGDPENEDSWKSGSYDIPVPSVEGESRVVNVRFECYKSTKFGVKPQVTGEAYEYPV